MVEIAEDYKDYEPPESVRKSVERLMDHTPSHYFAGLHSIVLTNTEAFNRKLRRQKTKYRKKKVDLKNCLGWYREKWNNEPANIDLVIDNILDGCPTWALNIKLVSDVTISGTLFHELGHHIHKTQAPEHREREDVAENWQKRLSRKYFWKRHWHIMILIWPFKPLFDLLLKRYDEKQKLTNC